MKTNLRQKAYEKIKSKILDLQVKPGDLLFENALGEELQIGRTPIHEALLLLENERLVECNSRLGYVVRKLTPKEVEEYYAIRAVIERFAVPLIIQGVKKPELNALSANIKKAKSLMSENDFISIIRCETEFHEILYNATQSTVLVDTLSRLVDKFHWLRGIALTSPGGVEESINDHEKMLAALTRKDAEKLAELTDEHLAHAQKKFAMMQPIFM